MSIHRAVCSFNTSKCGETDERKGGRERRRKGRRKESKGEERKGKGSPYPNQIRFLWPGVSKYTINCLFHSV